MFFAKKPSFDESPLQDLSADQLSQIYGGAGISLTSLLSQVSSGTGGSLNAATVKNLLQEWKKLHPNSSLSPATIQEIIKLSSEAKNFLGNS
jgi:hypothetical protein